MNWQEVSNTSTLRYFARNCRFASIWKRILNVMKGMVACDDH